MCIATRRRAFLVDPRRDPEQTHHTLAVPQADGASKATSAVVGVLWAAGLAFAGESIVAPSSYAAAVRSLLTPLRGIDSSPTDTSVVVPPDFLGGIARRGPRPSR